MNSRIIHGLIMASHTCKKRVGHVICATIFGRTEGHYGTRKRHYERGTYASNAMDISTTQGLLDSTIGGDILMSVKNTHTNNDIHRIHYNTKEA